MKCQGFLFWAPSENVFERQRNNNGNSKRNLKDGIMVRPTGGGKYSMFCYSRVLSKEVTAVVICDTISDIDRGSGANGLRE